MTHSEKARDLFCEGYNCAQAVFTAYCDVTKMDEATALSISSSFGGGMGRLREVCGAVSGVFMAAGILLGYTDPKDDIAKKEHYALIQDIARRFKEKNSSIICRELVEGIAKDTLPTPTPRNEEFYKTRPCLRFVMDACDILDEILEERKKES